MAETAKQILGHTLDYGLQWRQVLGILWSELLYFQKYRPWAGHNTAEESEPHLTLPKISSLTLAFSEVQKFQKFKENSVEGSCGARLSAFILASRLQYL